jgi:putative transposase
MIRQFIEYKAKLRNCIVVIANRFFPSSQVKLEFIPNPCSSCGEIKKNFTLKDRIYSCDSCGFEIDRDLNAAINLNNYAI